MNVLTRPHCAVGGHDDPHSLLPSLGDVVWQVECVDAGVVLLDIGPERADQNTREVDQRVVIQRRAAFIEVADENVADRAAADVVVVDQVRGRPRRAAARRGG